MSIGQFLIHWMVRSAILTIAGAILLRTFRVRDASFRMASWTAILCASAAVPILSGILPDVPLVVPRSELAFTGETKVPVSPVRSAAGSLPGLPVPIEYSGAAKPGRVQSLVKGLNVKRLNWGFDWSAAAVALYIVVCAVLLLRIGVGLVIGVRLRRGSMPTALNDICESNAVNAPVTLGIVRPAIVLPMDWRGWDRATLEAVLAHERSHVRRWDPAAQLFSAIHRALLWASPLSWFLHAKLVQTAEEVSDDAAVTVCDRVHYTEILLDFMNRKAPGLIGTGLPGTGLPMARYGDPEKRLLRILDEPAISSGITKRTAAAIIGVSLPITCLIAATKAEFAPHLDTVPGLAALQERYVSARTVSAPSVVDSGGRLTLKKTLKKTQLPAPVLAQVVAQAPGPVNAAPAPAEVRLTLSVADPAGRYVEGLNAQDFRVTRGGIYADISSFGLTEGEHSVVLLNTIAGGEEAVNALRSVLDSRDELAVLAGPPASDPAMLWDAVVAAVNQVKGMTNPYKSVVVIMQGGSPYPTAGVPDLARIVRAALRSPRVNVFFANIEDITKPYLGSQQDDLRILAASTGGQVVTAPSAGEIATSLKRLGVGLAHQYVIGFIPGNAPVGALGRPPRVEVEPLGGYPPLQVIGPGGYYVEP
jgi:BlaR1 peptidase M56